MTTSLAVGVVGFGRCGSTMMMAMLEAGGVPPRHAGPDYEATTSRHLADDLSDVSGRSVKLLCEAPRSVDIGVHPGWWKFVWLDRGPQQQARSTVKFMKAAGVRVRSGARYTLDRDFAASRDAEVSFHRRHGDVLELAYEDVVAAPGRAAWRLAQFLEPEHHLNYPAAAGVVPDRDPRCAPDLLAESSAAMAGAR